MARQERFGASPAAALALAETFAATDARDVLGSVRVPTLVLHRSGDRVVPVGNGRYLAEAIPGAQLVVLEGDDHWYGIDVDQILDEIEQFVTGSRADADVDRVLATILFTDIVGSTATAASLGDPSVAVTPSISPVWTPARTARSSAPSDARICSAARTASS